MPRHLPDRAVVVRRSPRVELAFEVKPPRRTRSWELRHEDKEILDDIMAWWSRETGERLTQWELGSILVAEALARREGPLAGWSPSRLSSAR